MSLLHRPKLLTAQLFGREAARRIAKASSRVALITTTLHDDDELSHAIVEALCKAGDVGTDVSVLADAYTYVEPKEFILRSPKRHPARAYRAMQLERKLRRHRVSFHWLGRMSNFGLFGRTHCKWLIVDNDVYAFGGVNIDRGSFLNNDFMLHIHDEQLADRLSGEQQRIRQSDRAGHSGHNRRIPLDGRSTLLIDGGIPGRSVIYSRAARLARECESAILVSQYCPTGRLGRILKRKHATMYFNRPSQAYWLNTAVIKFGMKTSGQHTAYTRDQYLHAKCIIYAMPNGRKVALTGSHNFVFGGVLLGTREVALETTDPQIIKQLESFIDNHVR